MSKAKKNKNRKNKTAKLSDRDSPGEGGEGEHGGEGQLLLLGAVLDRFLAEYANVNSFTQTVIVSRQRGLIRRFPPRTGLGPLI